MADKNLRIWDALYKTDPKQTKQFTRAGGFKGTATKPIWLTKRLTEYFGPAGTGWGMEKPEFQTVAASDEILVFCTVALWYYEPATPTYRAVVYGVGGDKVLTKRASGPFTNDEAFKSSYTDALSNAMKQIGVAADIHMGMFEDQKYVRETTAEFANDHPGLDEAQKNNEANGLAPKAPTKNSNATSAKLWTDAAIEALRFANTESDLDEWWISNQKATDKLEANHPDQYKRLQVASEEQRTAVGARQ